MRIVISGFVLLLFTEGAGAQVAVAYAAVEAFALFAVFAAELYYGLGYECRGDGDAGGGEHGGEAVAFRWEFVEHLGDVACAGVVAVVVGVCVGERYYGVDDKEVYRCLRQRGGICGCVVGA